MCIFFFPSQCPFKGESRRMPRLSNSSYGSYSRSGSFDTSFATAPSSRSSIVSNSSPLPLDPEKDGSGGNCSSSDASVRGVSDDPRHESHVDIVFQAAAALTQEIMAMDSTPSRAVSPSPSCATTTTTTDNMKQSLRSLSSSSTSSSITFGPCVEPTCADPLACARFQIRHRASTKNPTGWFDACSACTEHYTHHADDRKTRAMFRAVAAGYGGESDDEESDAAAVVAPASSSSSSAGGGGRKNQGLWRSERKLATGKYGPDYGASTVVFEKV